jgi:hypothetical protein
MRRAVDGSTRDRQDVITARFDDNVRPLYHGNLDSTEFVGSALGAVEVAQHQSNFDQTAFKAVKSLRRFAFHGIHERRQQPNSTSGDLHGHFLRLSSSWPMSHRNRSPASLKQHHSANSKTTTSLAVVDSPLSEAHQNGCEPKPSRDNESRSSDPPETVDNSEARSRIRAVEADGSSDRIAASTLRITVLISSHQLHERKRIWPGGGLRKSGKEAAKSPE